MSKEKKTAFDCVLSDLSSGDNDGCSSTCPIRNKCSSILCREECIEKLKNHYRQQATIPDGWENMKQIYTLLIERKNRDSIIKFIEGGFAEYGIEVNNETN